MKKSIKLAAWLAVIILTSIFLYWDNNSIEISKFDYSNDKIPESFDGYVITQVSDLHTKRFGKDQSVLLDKIRLTAPDIIVATGDFVDIDRLDRAKAVAFFEEAVKIAPVYYVSGNHEAWSGEYFSLKQQLKDIGVTVLDDETATLESGGSTVTLVGIKDPIFGNFYPLQVKKQLERLITDRQGFNMLLSHRPELIDVYAETGVDLAFTGHAHGGQIRLPFVGGLYAPNQGKFPKYTIGTYTKDATTVVVNRGLGNSRFPVRLFNRPEISVLTLRRG